MPTTEEKPYLTHTVGFSRKIQPKQYEGAEAQVFIQVNTDLDADLADVTQALATAFQAAKATVFDQLGVPYEVDDNFNIVETTAKPEQIVEDAVVRRFPGTQKAPQAQADEPYEAAPEAAPQADDGDAAPPYDPETTDRDERYANSRWGLERFKTHPDEFWDNRGDKRSGKRGPTFPDFKHKATGMPVWIPKKRSS